MSAEGVARNGGAVDAHAPSAEVEGEVLTSPWLDSRRALLVAVVLTMLALPLLIIDALPSGDHSSAQAQVAAAAPEGSSAQVATTEEPTTTTSTTEASTTSTTAAPTTTTVAPTTTAAPTTSTTAKATTTTTVARVAAARVAPATTPPTTAAPTTTAPPASAPPAPTVGATSSDAAFLACVRQRESSGNYGAVNGAGYYGAYQFSQSTWNNTASHASRGDLVGVRPDRVAPGDQDAMALHLLQWVGRSPWGGYC